MRRIVLTFAAALLAWPLMLLAEGHEDPPALSDVWWVVPKSGMENQFESAVATHMAFRADVGDSRQWWGYYPVIGKNMSAYVFRSCCYEWADQDAYAAESSDKGYGKHWNENVHQFVDHYHHYIEKTDWAHSYWPEEGTDGPYYGVTEWKWKEDAGPESSAARKELSKIALEHDWGNKRGPWVWMSRIGGSPTLMIVAPYADYASMAPPESSFYEMVTEAVGEEKGDALFADFSSGFASSDYSVWRYAENLSTPMDEGETEEGE